MVVLSRSLTDHSVLMLGICKIQTSETPGHQAEKPSLTPKPRSLKSASSTKNPPALNPKHPQQKKSPKHP